MATTVVKQVKAKNNLTKFQQVKLRMQLLGLVFIKNLSVFIWAILIVCMILAFTGVIDQNTPILKYIFGDLAITVDQIMASAGASENISEAIGNALSLITVTTLCTSKIQRITKNDIKSKRIKLLLVRAGMWFDSDGKLTRRIETVTKIDLNQDGKIGEKQKTEEEKQESIVAGLVRAGEEFVSVMKVDLSNINENNEELLYERVGLTETKDGVDDIQEHVKHQTKKLFVPEDTDTDEEKKEKLGRVKKVFSKIKSVFKKKKKEEPKIEETIDTPKPEARTQSININKLGSFLNNVEKPEVKVVDVEKIEPIQVKKEEPKIEEIKKEVVEEKKPQVQKPTQQSSYRPSSSISSLNSYLKNLKK